MRRLRQRQRAERSIAESYTHRKGRLLAKCFHLAWVRFSYTERFEREFKARFQSYQEGDYGRDNSSVVDFDIKAERRADKRLYLIPVEVKNWFVPQWLDKERFYAKIAKKFGFWQCLKTTMEYLGLFEPRDFFVKLLVVTEAVKFQPEVQRIMDLKGYRVETVDKLPFELKADTAVYDRDSVPPTVHRALEDKIVGEIVRILELVFYE